MPTGTHPLSIGHAWWRVKRADVSKTSIWVVSQECSSCPMWD